MSLQYLIQSGNYDSPQAAYDAITSPTTEVRDDQSYTWGGVADLIGPEAAEKLRIKFDTNGLGWVSLQLGGLGLPLTDSRVRLALTGFMQMGVEGCDVLLNKGITTISLAQQAGISPSFQEVTEMWNAWKAETDLTLLRESLRVRFDSILNQVGTSEQSQAVAELRLIATELEA